MLLFIQNTGYILLDVLVGVSTNEGENAQKAPFSDWASPTRRPRLGVPE